MFRTNHEQALGLIFFFGVSFPLRIPCLLATNAGKFQSQDAMNYYNLGQHSGS